MTYISITTDRLELIAGTPELVQSEMTPSRFTALIDAHIPKAWPPEGHHAGTMEFTAQRLREGSDQIGWWCWYFVLLDKSKNERVLIGIGGFKGQATPDGMVEIGYSVLPEFQRFGYATEAVNALTSWAFSHVTIEVVIAETLPELIPSIRVLEKNGFIKIAGGSEPGVIKFMRSRHGLVNLYRDPK
ncbi:MAG: GNAT family N-acetyltransferase [Moorea sp. SIO3G5]|nr:GNAT family N-acetyltransferase [Moorena sp. SIO3G5]